MHDMQDIHDIHDDFRDSESPVASTVSSLPPSPNFTPDSDLYTPTLSSLSLEEMAEVEEKCQSIHFESAETTETETADTEETDTESETETAAVAAATPHISTSSDDTSVEDEPSRHVDYLAHEWKEEDIWASWRYVTARKNDYSNGVRLENASWRTWAKAKHNLGTISPETLNWLANPQPAKLLSSSPLMLTPLYRLKDCDVTWLYGPLKTSDTETSDSPPPSRLETPNSYLERKPILKKKTASETILQRSLSQHTLLQHAGAILKAQEANGWRFQRSNTDSTDGTSHIEGIPHHQRTGSSTYSLGGTLTSSSNSNSGMTSPSERKHIHFNNEVVQCIAVEKGWPVEAAEDEDEDDHLMMQTHGKMQSRAQGQGQSQGQGYKSPSPRTSFSESKTIAPLPSTTLKCRDIPEPQPQPQPTLSILDRWSTLSPSSSVETLRPPPTTSTSNANSANFLLDDEDDEDPSLDFTSHYNQPWFSNSNDHENDDGGAGGDNDRGLHLTSSGMFMPEDQEQLNNGLLGRVVDTVNTARDIAHVIWNVGWRR